MGAQLGNPGKTVIDIDGDASFLMTCYELATIAEYNIPVKVAILNNDFQGMIKQWQDLFYQKRYSQSAMKNPNFAAMAEAFGVRGIRCDRKEDVAKTVEGNAQARRPGGGRFLRRAQRARLPDGPQRQGLHEMEHAGVTDRPAGSSSVLSRAFCAWAFISSACSTTKNLPRPSDAV
jgi:acetolactate synthase I/II/III large subunit